MIVIFVMSNQFYVVYTFTYIMFVWIREQRHIFFILLLAMENMYISSLRYINVNFITQCQLYMSVNDFGVHRVLQANTYYSTWINSIYYNVLIKGCYGIISHKYWNFYCFHHHWLYCLKDFGTLFQTYKFSTELILFLII